MEIFVIPRISPRIETLKLLLIFVIKIYILIHILIMLCHTSLSIAKHEDILYEDKSKIEVVTCGGKG